ncbi:MAG: Ig-like domain-containing protein [Deltaproteobacteria bacterium]|nr:Ig-like domain-containing protein [Deltaproteobacteria bacterium]
MKRSPSLPLAGLLGLSLLLSGCPSFDKKAMENNRPLVSAGEDQSVNGGETVTLSATGTDADQDELTYYWRQTQGPGVTLSEPTAREVTFASPEENTTLVFEVRAFDEFSESPPDLVLVDVRFNRPPVADAGTSWVTPNGTPLRLRGNAIDPDGDAIASWQWTVVSGPTGAVLSSLLTDADTRLPTFRSSVKGDYLLELVVGDGQALSAPVETLVLAENQAPVARGSATASAVDPFRFQLTGSPSSDPDGDAIAGWSWRIASVPSHGTASFDGATDQMTATLQVVGSGNFEVELVVTDPEGAESAPARVRVYANQAPLLSLNGPSFVAGAGKAFPLDASGSVDPEGDPILVTWTRTSGAPLFPDSQVGLRPVILAPSYRDLVDAGDPTSAVYEVVASDGVLESDPQTVTLFAGPSENDAVVVSSAATASDDGGCGTVEQPCETLARGLELITGGGAQGDGRTLLLTTGAFTDTTPQERAWPAGVDLEGGYDPVTFVRTAELTEVTFVQTAPACNNSTWGVTLPSGLAVKWSQIHARHTLPCTNTARLFLCSGCVATFEDCAAGIDAQPFSSYVFVAQSGGNLTLDRVSILTNGGQHADGLWIGGSTLTLRDSSVITNKGISGGRALELATGTAVIERTYLGLIGGAGSTNTSDTILVTGGDLYLRNSVVHHQATTNSALEIRGGTATLESSTVIASSTSAGGLVTQVPVNVANTIFDGGDYGIVLTNVASRGSLLFSNALASDGAALLRCRNSANIADLDQNDPTDLSACNDSGTPWTGNLAGPCPFVDAATADFHLETGLANPCLDAGAATTPLGVIPSDDLDGQSRPRGAGPDIGADEA